MAAHNDYWHCANGVAVEHFDSFAGIFCSFSGETHVVDAFPAEVLKYVASEQPVTPLAVAEQLARFLEEAPASWESPVRAVLEQLAEVGIVERCPP
jgi:hypothetical protein